LGDLDSTERTSEIDVNENNNNKSSKVDPQEKLHDKLPTRVNSDSELGGQDKGFLFF
jgi:hypothetical protein